MFPFVFRARGRAFNHCSTAKGQEQLGRANEHYANIEKDPTLQAVLVSVDSVAALRVAYPNYFLDTEAFLRTVSDAMAGA